MFILSPEFLFLLPTTSMYTLSNSQIYDLFLYYCYICAYAHMDTHTCVNSHTLLSELSGCSYLGKADSPFLSNN